MYLFRYQSKALMRVSQYLPTFSLKDTDIDTFATLNIDRRRNLSVLCLFELIALNLDVLTKSVKCKDLATPITQVTFF